MPRERILIVEDDPPAAHAISTALSLDEFRCDGAENLAEARKRLHHRYDLILLDIMLPDGSGFRFLEELRRKSSVPVVVLTARTETSAQMRGLMGGATVYLKKPLESEVVVAQVKALLRPREQPTDPVLSVGALVCDTRTRRICYHGEPVDVSAREYDILHLLLRNPGQVFSRREIMDLVWEDPGSARDTTVATHIGHMRRKLERIRDGTTPIRTRERNGFGYYLAAER